MKKSYSRKKSTKSKRMQEWRKAGQISTRSVAAGTAGWFCGRAPHSASPGSSGTRGRVQHRAGGVLRHLPHCCRGHVVCGFGCSPTELGISAVDFPVQAAFFLFLYPRTFVSIGPVLEVEMSSRQW